MLRYTITADRVSWFDPESGEEKAVFSYDTEDYLAACKALMAGEIPGHSEPESKFEVEKVPHDDMPSVLVNKWKRLPELVSTQEELDIAYGALSAFWIKLRANPSYRSRKMALDFIEHNNVPITATGTLLLFKRVLADYYDCHTGSTHEYKVGTIHSMERSMVDNDPSSPCSAGLHAGGYDYVRFFVGSRIMAVEVDPEDVVSVPHDSSYGKVRVCKLKVVAEFKDVSEMLEVSKRLVAVPHEKEYTMEDKKSVDGSVEAAYEFIVFLEDDGQELSETFKQGIFAFFRGDELDGSEHPEFIRGYQEAEGYWD
jgi:hypothetical protein